MLVANVALELAAVVWDISERALRDLRLPVLANSPNCLIPAD